ncbi:MAG: hypothetical protein HKN68_01830 [Saprospiraceae bacterium]|nr:hypothetical protein [Saprospiraceae bacterium]
MTTYRNFHRKIGSIDLDDLYEATVNGELNGINFASKIDEIRTSQDKEEKKKLKGTLPGTTVSGKFQNARKLDQLERYTGFIQIDIDDIGEESAVNITKKMSSNPLIFYAALSPGGDGLKSIMKVDTGPDEHREAFEMVSDYIDKTYDVKVDRGISDITRLMYLTYDPECHYNPEAYTFEIKDKLNVTIGGINNDFNISDQLDNDTHQAILQAYLANRSIGEYKEGKRNTYVHRFASMCNMQEYLEI